MTDWVAWHRPYDDPDTPLARRLNVVQRHLRAALDGAPPGTIRVVSVCAGQGHDVIGAVTGHPRAGDVRARLVELDARNAALAAERVAAAGLAEQVEVAQGDAGALAAYVAMVPAQVVLLCGVLGNVSDADVRRALTGMRQLCATAGHLVWTRHRRPPDLTPAIRGWLAALDFAEVSYDAPRTDGFAVGTHRYTGAPAVLEPEGRLFTFLAER